MSAALAAPVVAILALVADDDVALRTAPRENAPAPVRLYRGDWLEVRGENAGFINVYDHRRERPGFVRPTQVRVHPASDAATFALLAGFLRDLPGFESLGLAYAALARKASAEPTNPALAEAVGTMADRLARRASRRNLDAAQNAVLHGQLQVAESWGATFLTVEDEEATRTCYDGQAFRESLSQGAQGVVAVRAALGLANSRCLLAQADAAQLRAWNEWRAQVLASVSPQGVTPALAQHLLLRRAEVNAELAFQRARLGDVDGARDAAGEATHSFMLVERALLAEEDRPLADQVAVRVAATRGAAEPAAPLPAGVTLSQPEDRPGETCVRVGSLERCTYGLVWPALAAASPNQDVVAVAVQPLPSWTELWVFHRVGQDWQLHVLLPPSNEPGLGYVEAAGFSPDGKKLLVAREAIHHGALERRFQVVEVGSFKVERWAPDPEQLAAFKRWASPRWRGTTVALRGGASA